MNKFEIIGNLTSDIKLEQTKDGIDVTRFTLAINMGKDKDGNRKTNYIDLSAWRSTAKLLSDYSKKGDKLFVCGHIQPREQTQYTQEGKEFKDIDMTLIVDEIEFLSPRKNEEKDSTKEK